MTAAFPRATGRLRSEQGSRDDLERSKSTVAQRLATLSDAPPAPAAIAKLRDATPERAENLKKPEEPAPQWPSPSDPPKPRARALLVDLARREISADQKRVLWRRHCEEHARAFDAWWAAGGVPMRPVMPVLPEVCRGLACGAKTRAGSPCKLTSIFIHGRCKLHGGVSTGPTTTQGKARAARNGLVPKERSP